MVDFIDNNALEVTDDQLTELQDLDASESELEDLSVAEEEEWIADLRAVRKGQPDWPLVSVSP